MRDRVDVAEAVVARGLRERLGFFRGAFLGHRAQVAPARLRSANVALRAGDRAVGHVRDVANSGKGVERKTEDGGGDGGLDHVHGVSP